MEVIYIHARPQGHPTHKKYAETVSSASIYYDYILRWHDIPSGKIKKIASWILCAIFFKRRKKYNVFYSDGIAYFPVVMKKLGLINSRRQKLISLQSDETLYFLKNNLYSPFSKKLLLWALKSYDSLICIGHQQALLANDLLGLKHTNISVIYNGLSAQKIISLKTKRPLLNNCKILFVSNIQSNTRAHYKGLDVLLDTFMIVSANIPEVELHIAGNVDLQILNEHLSRLNLNSNSKIKALGYVENLADIYENYSLYVHIARGEVWGLSIAEAAVSGLPVLISNETGVKEVIGNNDKFIVEINAKRAAEKVINYFNLSQEEKYNNARYLREAFSKYEEEAAILNFKNVFIESYKKTNPIN